MRQWTHSYVILVCSRTSQQKVKTTTTTHTETSSVDQWCQRMTLIGLMRHVIGWGVLFMIHRLREPPVYRFCTPDMTVIYNYSTTVHVFYSSAYWKLWTPSCMNNQRSSLKQKSHCMRPHGRWVVAERQESERRAELRHGSFQRLQNQHDAAPHSLSLQGRVQGGRMKWWPGVLLLQSKWRWRCQLELLCWPAAHVKAG